jgi:outer membrane lipoprotein-sorting protein
MLLIFGVSQVSAELTAQEILAKFAASQQRTFIGKLEMRVHKPEKEDRVYIFKIWVKGKNLALMRYLAPAREKGNGCLKIGKDMYMYLPNIDKTMRITGRQVLSNSDFSSADILGMDLLGDYNATFENSVTEDNIDFYLLRLKAKTHGAVYPQVRIWIRKSDFIPVKQEYYTASGKLLRTLRYDEVETVGGIAEAKRMTMTNTLVAGEYTVVNVLEGVHDQTIPDSIFTISNLEHGN